MIRVVLDTNIIVSAYLNQNGFPFLILKLALAGLVQPCASEAILEEYEELLLRKSRPLDKRRARLLLKKIRSGVQSIQPSARLAAYRRSGRYDVSRMRGQLRPITW
jgi:putative PIN family toxin of toxin-antitoxin system